MVVVSLPWSLLYSLKWVCFFPTLSAFPLVWTVKQTCYFSSFVTCIVVQEIRVAVKEMVPRLCRGQILKERCWLGYAKYGKQLLFKIALGWYKYLLRFPVQLTQKEGLPWSDWKMHLSGHTPSNGSSKFPCPAVPWVQFGAFPLDPLPSPFSKNARIFD